MNDQFPPQSTQKMRKMIIQESPVSLIPNFPWVTDTPAATPSTIGEANVASASCPICPAEMVMQTKNEDFTLI